jgi:hypothetical protein
MLGCHLHVHLTSHSLAEKQATLEPDLRVATQWRLTSLAEADRPGTKRTAENVHA